MTAVAVIGAGAGGAAAVVELSAAGHDVRWWNRNAETIAPFRHAGGVHHQGVLGDGTTAPSTFSPTLAQALDGADVAMVCLPALVHEAVAQALADAAVSCPVLLNPGHTGGALHMAESLRRMGATVPPLVEFSTLTYVARKVAPDTVSVTGVARRVRMGALGDAAVAAELAAALYPAATGTPNVLGSSLANVNLVLHTPGALFSAAWVEATAGDFTFYVDAMTPGVARSIETLDSERLAVAAAFGLELEPLMAEMTAIGTIDTPGESLREAVSGAAANRTIRAPDSLDHRYYREDFEYGLVPMVALAGAAGVAVPFARGLIDVASVLLGRDMLTVGLTAQRLGIAGLNRDQLLKVVTG